MKKLLRYLEIVPIGIAVVVTMYFAVESPVSDDWDFVPIIKAMRDGALNWQLLDTPYAGHKIPVTYAVISSLAVVTHWNSYLLRAATLLIWGGAWLALRPAVVRKGRLLECAFLFWSLSLSACWLWAVSMSSAIAIFCVVWGLRLLAVDGIWSFALGTFLAVAGTFSFAAGVAIWPAGAYLILTRSGSLVRKTIFLGFLAATAWLYLQHSAAPPKMEQGTNLENVPIFLLYALGEPFCFAPLWTAAVASLIGLTMLVLGRPTIKELGKEPFVTSLAIAAAAMMGLLVIFRGGGPNPMIGMDPRYAEIYAFFWVVLILMVDWGSWRRHVLTLIVALCLLRSLTRFPHLIYDKKNMLAGIHGIETGSKDRFIMKGDNTSAAQFDHDIELMREWHYSLFRDHESGR